MLCRATQDRWDIVKGCATRYTGGGNSNPPQYSCRKNPMNSMKRQKDMTLEDEPPPRPRSEGIQYATGEEQRAITNSSRENEVVGQKQECRSVVDVSSGESKVQCCKEWYFIGTWNFRSMNQGKLDMVKLEMVRLNTDILWISPLHLLLRTRIL